ncbi:Imm26 family immunity protein [uncultured Campylobacter sp.]|uniref:Imm26 family immunity protein n=1 Tax=uncultured Campylobacter sp. TaxID=218934 RepID=UPI0028E83787|nr:Imm26 family immunity protein [uncultured Campylobacter sp.]
MFELNNEQRAYFGLDAVQQSWERVEFAGDKFRPASVLYFEGDVIKKHVVSTDELYAEYGYDEATKGREILLPKTAKGKETKLTPANFEKRTPLGVYLYADKYSLRIASFASQTTFYDSVWESGHGREMDFRSEIERFIADLDSDHARKIEEFKKTGRKNIKFKSGDFFRFKLDRNRYGFGRVILDGHKLRKSGLLPEGHEMLGFMGKPVFVELFAYASQGEASVGELMSRPRLPMDVMFDNAFFYGEFEIFAHEKIDSSQLDFPMSFHVSPARTYLQWGFIEICSGEQSVMKAASRELKELIEENNLKFNCIGFSPRYAQFEIAEILRGEELAYQTNDLRDPEILWARQELMRIFGLDPAKSYFENAQRLGVKTVLEL